MPYREPEPHERKHTTPSYEEGPFPWERPELSWFGRLSASLGSCFEPIASARATAEGRVGPSVLFAVLTALPFTLVGAIIPFTHTLLFKPSFALERLPHANEPGLSVEADLARAVLIGLVLALVSLLSWSVPFASLLRAFSRDPQDPQTTRAALRLVFYRLWIVPFGMALFWLSVWGMPATLQNALGEVTLLCFQLLPRTLILMHCHAMARFWGASTGAAMLVAIVPLGVEMAAAPWVWQVAQNFVPAIPDATLGGSP